jgi:hypothetical protein
VSNHKEFLITQKKKYYQIECIVCPVLDNEKVYFNNYGLNHLIRKRGKPRPIYDQRRRFKLLKYCFRVISDIDVEIKYEKIVNKKGKAEFWCLSKKINKKEIKIIIRRVGTGKLHFFSIYS